MHDSSDSRTETGQIACAQTRRALPWYVNGTLAEAERLRLLQHLAACPTCTAEHAAELRFVAALHAPDALVAPSCEAGWQKLEAQLDLPHPAPGRTANRVLAFAVVAQAVAIVLLTTLLVVQHNADRGLYATVSEPQLAGSIRMVLDPARGADATALARGAGARLAPPSAAEVGFTLVIETAGSGDTPARSVDAAVEWLRRQPGVLLAEPIGPKVAP